MNSPPGHILLVDDEPAFQRLGATWLQALGHRVSIAGDSDSALQRFKDSRPDVVLLDLVMPPTLTPEAGLSLLPSFAAAPVIVITGHADHELALKATDAEAWDSSSSAETGFRRGNRNAGSPDDHCGLAGIWKQPF